MHAKVFDPFTEDAVNRWLATTPVKVIHSARVFDTALDGRERQVALVFYEEEQTVGREPSPTSPSTSGQDAVRRLFGLDASRG